MSRTPDLPQLDDGPQERRGSVELAGYNNAITGADQYFTGVMKDEPAVNTPTE